MIALQPVLARFRLALGGAPHVFAVGVAVASDLSKHSGRGHLDFARYSAYAPLSFYSQVYFVPLLQKKIKRKEIALLVGCSQSTLSREIRRNSTDKGNYLWDKAHAKAMDRRKRTTANHAKDPAIVWEALDLLKEDYWLPEQISADMKSRGKNISHELIYRHIRADQSGELASYCRHKMKYNRHVRPNRTTKVKNIPDRVSIHQRPAEADGTRFGDWEMDTIVGKDGKGPS